MMGPRLTLLDPPKGADENCYISATANVRSVLRAVAAAGARAAAYFEDERRFIHTSLLGLTTFPARLVFEKGPDAALNARLLKADTVTFVTSDDGVPVQFSCHRPSLTQYQATEAFRIGLPERVLRLQRRGYYRLPGEPTHALLRCELIPDNDRSRIVKAAVFDLSCGGLGAAVSAAEPLLPVGSTHGCTVELPGLGKIQPAVAVRVVSEIMLPNALPGTRYGLEFLNLAEEAVALVARYIEDHQRGRRTVQH